MRPKSIENRNLISVEHPYFSFGDEVHFTEFIFVAYYFTIARVHSAVHVDDKFIQESSLSEDEEVLKILFKIPKD